MHQMYVFEKAKHIMISQNMLVIQTSKVSGFLICEKPRGGSCHYQNCLVMLLQEKCTTP